MLLATFLATVVITQSVANSTARGLSELWIVVVFLLTLIAVLRRVLIHQEVTLETICGALSAYLLLGLMFSAGICRTVAHASIKGGVPDMRDRFCSF